MLWRLPNGITLTCCNPRAGGPATEGAARENGSLGGGYRGAAVFLRLTAALGCETCTVKRMIARGVRETAP